MRFNNFKTYLSSTSEQVQVVDSADRQFFLEDKYIVLQRFFHFQRGLFKTSLWSRLCRLRHLSLHSGLQLLRFLQLPSCQSLSFILLPRIWNVRFYAQELNLVNWGWRSSLLQQVVIWPELSGCLTKMSQAKYAESRLLNCRPLVQTGWIFRSVFIFINGI